MLMPGVAEKMAELTKGVPKQTYAHVARNPTTGDLEFSQAPAMDGAVSELALLVELGEAAAKTMELLDRLRGRKVGPPGFMAPKTLTDPVALQLLERLPEKSQKRILQMVNKNQ